MRLEFEDIIKTGWQHGAIQTLATTISAFYLGTSDNTDMLNVGQLGDKYTGMIFSGGGNDTLSGGDGDDVLGKISDTSPIFFFSEGERAKWKLRRGKAWRHGVKEGIQMDFNPQSSVTDLLKAALHRVDGIAMYISITAVSIAAIVVTLKNIILGIHGKSEWLLPKLAIVEILCIILLYFNFAQYTSENDNVGRVFNALCLLGLTAFFLIKII